MRAAIVGNRKDTQCGQVSVALAEAGVLTDVFRPFRDGPLPGTVYHGIVVLGGVKDAQDDAGSTYGPALVPILRDCRADGLPGPGICLGAQILARAHRAENRIGTAPEPGWHPVALTEAGRGWVARI